LTADHDGVSRRRLIELAASSWTSTSGLEPYPAATAQQSSDKPGLAAETRPLINSNGIVKTPQPARHDLANGR